MKKLFLLLGFLISLTTFSQTTERVTINNGVLTLKGKGKIGLRKDQYQYYQFNSNVNGSYYLQAYFKTLTNKASSYSGLAFRNLGGKLATDGGVPYLAVIIQNDTLKVVKKSNYNEVPITVYANGNLKIPIHLRIEKSNNNFIVYYSNQSESASLVNFTQIISLQDAFTGWTNVTQNFITGSNLNTIQTALASKRLYANFTPPVVDGGGQGQVSFQNILKTVAPETQTDKFSVLPFAGITTPLKSYDGTRLFPKYPIVWHSKLDNFISANKKVFDVGISFPSDIKPNFGNQSGDGVLCVDYIRYADPNSGQAWANGIDPACNVSVNAFISARPFHRRMKGEGGTTVNNNETNEQLYDHGIEYTRSDQFGYGDNVGIKTNTGFNSADVENGEHGRFEEIPVLIGMANSTFGHATSMYNQAINVAFPDLSHYPISYTSGGYPSNKLNLDGSQAVNGNTGSPIANNVINEAWKPENKVTINSREIVNKGLIDFENAKESSEVSCYSSAAFFQGEVINYDGTNTRVTNKFGLNRNAEHIIAHTIYAVQVRKWHLRKNFNNRGFYTLAKTLCDRGNIGLTSYSTGTNFVTNPALSAKHLPRKLAFLKTMFVPFEGSYFHHWDRNTIGKNIDGDNGDLGAINLIHQKKNLSQGSFSFVDLFDDWDFKLWTAEISYDGGITWKQEKGTDYIMSQTSIPHAQCVTNNGIWAVFLARPENTEMTSCRLRIMYGGSYKYLDITPSMWETTNYEHRNTLLANIPNSDKDYYYNLIDISGGGVTGENTTPVAPTITKNIANPTANQSVTFTSSGCQSSYVNKWYDSAEGNLLGSGLTYTVNAVNGNGYFAKCVGTTNSSTASNTITFVITPPVSSNTTITEPNKAQYFFSDGHAPSYYANRNNLPSIITNTSTFDAVNDVVYLENSQMKIGINLKRGGQICYASVSGSTTNLVYNGSDGGLQWQLDATQYLVNGTLNGQTSGSPQNNVNYNTTMGGDYNNHSQTLIDYHAITNGYYVKFRPIMYNFNAVISEIEVEATYTLIGNDLKIDYVYTSFRTDGSIETGNNFRFMGWAIPILFLTNNFTKYQIYTGSSPWTNGNLNDGEIPNVTGNQNPAIGLSSKEFWGLSYDPTNNIAVGVYNASEGGTEASLRWEQLNKFSGGSSGTVFSGPYTTMSILSSVVVPNGANYTKSMAAHITIGDKSIIQGRFRTISGN